MEIGTARHQNTFEQDNEISPPNTQLNRWQDWYDCKDSAAFEGVFCNYDSGRKYTNGLIVFGTTSKTFSGLYSFLNSLSN